MDDELKEILSRIRSPPAVGGHPLPGAPVPAIGPGGAMIGVQVGLQLRFRDMISAPTMPPEVLLRMESELQGEIRRRGIR